MKVYIAKTHSPEYLMHKYWARKPHNIVSQFVRKYAKPGTLVVDPFCGSCVTNIESAKLGIDSVGIDVNPLAILIGRVAASFSPIDKVEAMYNDFIENIYKKCRQCYCIDGKDVKYFIHELILRCPECRNDFRIDSAKKKNKSYICPHCGVAANANLGTINGSYVTGVCFLEQEKVLKDPDLLSYATKCAGRSVDEELGVDSQEYDASFIENKRILSYANTKLSKFYTSRSFSVVSYFADRIHSIQNEKIRDIFLLCLTATSTQASRLIPHRNELSTGGPAWSVPGFWIPAQHLELNPIFSFESRFKKILKGLLHIYPLINRKASVTFYDLGIENAIKSLKGKSISYIFADPPYGDSIPYLEFSAIWNSWLKKSPNYKAEIVVSDSAVRNKSWERYKVEMVDSVCKLTGSLTDGGHFTFTFNQLSFGAWHTLMLAAEKTELDFEDISIALPAVIPAKARFSLKGSYIGDFYVTFRKVKNAKRNRIDDRELKKKLDAMFSPLAKQRRGVFYRPHVVRAVIGWILKNGYEADAVMRAEDYVRLNFSGNGSNKLAFQQYQGRGPENLLSKILRDKISSILVEKELEVWDIVKQVLESFPFEEAPEVVEILEELDSISEKKNNRYRLKIEHQDNLFNLRS